MKKLALALMCLVSVAFFASCDPTEKNPSISVNSGEGYLTNGQTIEMETDYSFGFTATSNLYTNKELYRLVVTAEYFDTEGASTGKDELDRIELTGTAYSYTGTLHLTSSAKDLLGSALITAVVTDAAGETASAEIKVNVNDGGVTPPSQQLLGQAFDWYRTGLTLNSAEDMKKVGLDWPGNYPRVDYVRITPLTGCTMFIINDGDKYNEITTVGEKDAFFANLKETATPDTQYNEISAWQGKDYNTMLAVIDASGEYHLVHFVKATTQMVSAGALIHLTGELK